MMMMTMMMMMMLMRTKRPSCWASLGAVTACAAQHTLHHSQRKQPQPQHPRLIRKPRHRRPRHGRCRRGRTRAQRARFGVRRTTPGSVAGRRVATRGRRRWQPHPAATGTPLGPTPCGARSCAAEVAGLRRRPVRTETGGCWASSSCAAVGPSWGKAEGRWERPALRTATVQHAIAGRSRVGGKPCPADVRHPLGASAVVAVPERSSGGCSKVGAGLMSPALRASPQLTPPTSSAVAGESGARARTEARPAALRPPHPCSLADREDREEQQCGQEARGGSHCLLQLPLHMGLLQSRSLGRLRLLAWCAGWVVR